MAVEAAEGRTIIANDIDNKPMTKEGNTMARSNNRHLDVKIDP